MVLWLGAVMARICPESGGRQLNLNYSTISGDVKLTADFILINDDAFNVDRSVPV